MAVILVVALFFTFGCVLASLARLFYVVVATPVDPSSLAARLRTAKADLPPDPLRALDHALDAIPRADWERDLVRGLMQPAEPRAARVGEAMTELDFLLRRWARVPRVCASLASSFGFLLATVALRVGLSDLAGTLDSDQVLSVNGAVLDAIDVAAVGLVGTAFCIAIQYRGRAAVGVRLAGAERLVEVLEGFEDAHGGALAATAARASVDAPKTTERTESGSSPSV
jgi:hypothetical protein